jgi:hypothetical protein
MSKDQFVRIRLDLEYVVPDERQFIEAAKGCLLEDIRSAVKHNTLHNEIKVERAPRSTWRDVPSMVHDVVDMTRESDES